MYMNSKNKTATGAQYNRDRLIIRRKRRKPRKLSWLILLMVLALIITGINSILPDNANASEVLDQRPMTQVIVKDGDNLWQLSKEYQPNYKGDIRKAIYEIKKINGLKGSELQPGQILLIPMV